VQAAIIATITYTDQPVAVPEGGATTAGLDSTAPDDSTLASAGEDLSAATIFGLIVVGLGFFLLVMVRRRQSEIFSMTFRT